MSSPRPSGALRIFLYNWPVYVVTWAASIVTLGAARWLPSHVALACALAAGGALAWSAFSLLVSFYIYDRSYLVGGQWILSLLPSPPDAWATIHAGLDAEVDVDAVFTGRCAGRLDIFDPTVMTSPSIGRARHRTPLAHAATRCTPTALSLGDGSCDAILVAFTAHEIRDARAREKFFDELHRALRAGGRIVLVEHLRDVMNLIAFGPGFLHFVARREWLRLAAHARLTVIGEARITPFVMALALEKSS